MIFWVGISLEKINFVRGMELICILLVCIVISILSWIAKVIGSRKTLKY